ncbi:9886_t:CDS:2 [Dentiscutata erythropus]|uniref:9886_t:CDS:1 n=1 Tax=Dentiscutata erythropus TaxID=1348616 RepID=A0A9N8ZAA2_9GLOM|nr:9886_t:CDS:2 [Dentiscutata erythropus]
MQKKKIEQVREEAVTKQDNHAFKHAAQFTLSQHITAIEPLILQLVNETLHAIPLPELPMTDIELKLLQQLDQKHFNVQSPINLRALQLLTCTHPN